MTDVVDQLRAVNPEDPECQPLPPFLGADRIIRRADSSPRSRVRPRWAVAGSAAAAGAIAVTATLMLSGGSGPGLAERAYAATSSPGVAHWRVRIDAYANGSLSTQQSEEGWSRDGVTHLVLHTMGAGRTVTTERHIADGVDQQRVDDGPISSGPEAQTDLNRALPGPDPFSAFRSAYASDRLRKLSDTTFAVDPANAPTTSPSLVYEIDPSTAEPIKLTETLDSGATSMRVVTTFDQYEVLPADAHSEAALDMGDR